MASKRPDSDVWNIVDNDEMSQHYGTSIIFCFHKKSASMTVMIKAIGQATCPAIFNPLNAMISQMIGSIANKK